MYDHNNEGQPSPATNFRLLSKEFLNLFKIGPELAGL